MNITQNELIDQVALQNRLEVTTVSEAFRATGEIVFDYLSSATPSEDVVVQLLPGISLNSQFMPEHIIENGTLQGEVCPDKFKVNAHVTRRYKERLRDKNYYGNPMKS